MINVFNEDKFIDGSAMKTFEFSAANWVIIGIYLAGILILGLFFQFQRRKNKLEASSQEYFKASGSVPGWAVGLSVFATSLSAITFVSTPETTFTTDWGVVIGAMIIPISAPFLIKYVIPFYRQLQTKTAYGYLEHRYGRATQFIVSVFYIFYHTIRIGVVTYLPTIVISAVLPQANPYIIALVISIIALSTAVWGGTRGVIWADVVQAIFLTAGILVICIFGMAYIGNVSGTYNGQAVYGDTSFAATADFAYKAGKYVAANRWVLTFSQLGIPTILMTYFVSVLYSVVCGHDLVQRYQSAKRLSDTKKALYLNACMFFTTFFMFYGLGTILYQLFTTSYSIGAASGFGIAQFGKGTGLIATTGTGVSAIADLNLNALGYSSPTGIISNYTNFQGVNNQFVSQITIDGTSYGLISTSAIVPYFLVTGLPIGVSGIVIASIMAAAQGTNGSGMVSGSEVFVRDLILPYKPNLSEKKQVVIGKVVSLGMGVVGYAVTAGLISGGVTQVFLFFNSLQGIFGAPVLAAFLMGMFGTYIKRNAMTVAIYTGHAFAIIMFLLGDSNIAYLTGWNGGTSFFNNQWGSVLTFAFIICVSFIYQFFENIIKYKGNPFYADENASKVFENYTWAYMSKKSQLISEVEIAVSLDERAYAKYVKSHYADKANSKDPLELQKKLVSYKEFIQMTSYERYVINRAKWNKIRTVIFRKPILDEQSFKAYRLEYLNRELQRGNITKEYLEIFK